MVNKTPTPILINSDILSRIVSDVLSVSGVPSSKKSACLNKVAARIAGPKHNFGYLTGRDQPVIANGIRGLSVQAIEAEQADTEMNHDPDYYPLAINLGQAYRAREVTINYALQDAPILLLNGFPGDGKVPHVERLAKHLDLEFKQILLETANVLLGSDGALLPEFRPARNDTVTVYVGVEYLDTDGLKALVDEIRDFLAERTNGAIVFTSSNPMRHLKKVFEDYPMVTQCAEVHTLRLDPAQQEKISNPELKSRSFLNEALNMAHGNPALRDDADYDRSCEDLITLARSAPGYSSRVADFMDSKEAWIDYSNKLGDTNSAAWRDALRMGYLYEQVSKTSGNWSRNAALGALEKFAKDNLHGYADDFINAVIGSAK